MLHFQAQNTDNLCFYSYMTEGSTEISSSDRECTNNQYHYYALIFYTFTLHLDSASQ